MHLPQRRCCSSQLVESSVIVCECVRERGNEHHQTVPTCVAETAATDVAATGDGDGLDRGGGVGAVGIDEVGGVSAGVGAVDNGVGADVGAGGVVAGGGDVGAVVLMRHVLPMALFSASNARIASPFF
jgi:hypothetical protein